jgi:cellobiose dehydrogenase (acceptor)
MQGTVRPGAASVTTAYPYNARYVVFERRVLNCSTTLQSNFHNYSLLVSRFCYCWVLINTFSLRSTGITSRGRIGIDAAMTARPLITPWFTDPVDKAVLIQGINDIVANIKSGMSVA